MHASASFPVNYSCCERRTGGHSMGVVRGGYIVAAMSGWLEGVSGVLRPASIHLRADVIRGIAILRKEKVASRIDEDNQRWRRIVTWPEAQILTLIAQARNKISSRRSILQYIRLITVERHPTLLSGTARYFLLSHSTAACKLIGGRGALWADTLRKSATGTRGLIQVSGGTSLPPWYSSMVLCCVD